MATIFLPKDAQELLKNKYVVVMGGSIQRSIYKDLIRLIQGNTYLTDSLLRMKGEDTCLGDKLLDGGMRGTDKKGVGYREVRQYQTDFFFLQFVFMTRSFNSYVDSVINKFRAAEQKPDVIIINSCLWDITRYGKTPVPEYKQNLHKLFKKLKADLPDCLVIWNTNPAISHNPKGGVFVPGTDHLKDSMELHVLEANYYASKAAIEHGHDVIDLHYFLRHQIHRRAEDGIHWDMTGHRRITNLILTQIAQTWDVKLPKHIKVVVDGQVVESEKAKDIRENDNDDKFKTKIQNKMGANADAKEGSFKSIFDKDVDTKASCNAPGPSKNENKPANNAKNKSKKNKRKKRKQNLNVVDNTNYDYQHRPASSIPDFRMRHNLCRPQVNNDFVSHQLAQQNVNRFPPQQHFVQQHNVHQQPLLNNYNRQPLTGNLIGNQYHHQENMGGVQYQNRGGNFGGNPFQHQDFAENEFQILNFDNNQWQPYREEELSHGGFSVGQPQPYERYEPYQRPMRGRGRGWGRMPY